MLVAFLQLDAASSQPTIDLDYPEPRDKYMYHSIQYVSKLENLDESQRTMLTKLANQTEKLDMIINRLNDVSTCEQKSPQSGTLIILEVLNLFNSLKIMSGIKN